MPKNYRVYARTLEACEQRCLDDFYESEGGHIDNQRYLACLQECRNAHETTSPQPTPYSRVTPTPPPPYRPQISSDQETVYTSKDRPNPAEVPVVTSPTVSKAKQTYDECEKKMKKVVGNNENLYNPLCGSIAIGFEALMDLMNFIGNLLKNYTFF